MVKFPPFDITNSPRTRVRISTYQSSKRDYLFAKCAAYKQYSASVTQPNFAQSSVSHHGKASQRLMLLWYASGPSVNVSLTDGKSLSLKDIDILCFPGLCSYECFKATRAVLRQSTMRNLLPYFRLDIRSIKATWTGRPPAATSEICSGAGGRRVWDVCPRRTDDLQP